MVPDSYITYFAAVTGAAGALIGLLFVSVSLRPDTVFGGGAPERGRTRAAAAFTGLVNTFFLSMTALLPNSNLGYPAVFLAVASLSSTFRFRGKIARSRNQLAYLFLSTTAFTFQAVEGVGASGIRRMTAARACSTVVAISIRKKRIKMERAMGERRQLDATMAPK